MAKMMLSTTALLSAFSLLAPLTTSQNTTDIPFDPREATISSVHHALLSGSTTCTEVVTSFLSRITALNPAINAIISLDPTSLSTAASHDALLASPNTTAPLPPLFCIPILLKDNFDTSTVPTTGSSLRLARSRPRADAPTVAAFRAAGAVVLGKTNLHELALEGLSVSSLGGQTVNPYDAGRTAGGSSGGTGAAVAASLAVFGTGTDTVNSLRSPASANGLVSVRPSWGLVSRRGVVPISYTQDVVGVIGRGVEDVAVALGVMKGVGFDAGDNATAVAPREARAVDYAVGLKGGTLRGKRIGWLEGFFNRTRGNETDPVNEAMAGIEGRLRAAGAVIVPVTEAVYNATELLATVDVQQYEFRQLMDEYLSNPDLGGEHPRSLAEFYGNSTDFLVIPQQYSYVNTALVSSTSNTTTASRPSYATVKQRIANLTLALHRTFAANDLDAIVYPEQKNLVVKVGSPSQAGRNGILAATTGFPVVAMPAGYSARTAEAPEGIPIGLEILGRPFSEDHLFQMAYQLERLTRLRRAPQLARTVVETRPLQSVPVVSPNRGNVPSTYPLGRLST